MPTFPDKWSIIKVTPKGQDTFYKVFACFYGGFAQGDSWKMNSGIESWVEEDDKYIFVGFSGSKYVCHKSNEGMSNYGSGVFAKLKEYSKPHKISKISMNTFRKVNAKS